jgi:hypothetical protein
MKAGALVLAGSRGLFCNLKLTRLIESLFFHRVYTYGTRASYSRPWNLRKLARQMRQREREREIGNWRGVESGFQPQIRLCVQMCGCTVCSNHHLILPREYYQHYGIRRAFAYLIISVVRALAGSLAALSLCLPKSSTLSTSS